MAKLEDMDPAALETLGTKAQQMALQKIKALLPSITDPHRRGRVLGHLFALERKLGLADPWFSQAGQDRWLDAHVFDGKRDGVFVEVGAFDGITGSNTLAFEVFRNWSGILIEPSPTWAAKARVNRRLPVIEVAAGSEAGSATFLDVAAGYTQMGGLADTYDADLRAQVEGDTRFQGQEVEVAVRPLADLLSEQGLIEVDYISLDVEGAETVVLETFPFHDFQITAWTIENNAASGQIAHIMKAAGYQRDACLGVDEIWLRRDLVDGDLHAS
jgi:FkbM family methyltransferase